MRLKIKLMWRRRGGRDAGRRRDDGGDTGPGGDADRGDDLRHQPWSAPVS